MWTCEICDGKRYSVTGGVVQCFGCENTFPADARLEEVTIEAMGEPGGAPSRVGSRNKKNRPLKGICRKKKKEKLEKEGTEATNEVLASTSGIYVENKTVRSKRAKAHLDALVTSVTALNSECGYGIILVASAVLPKQGPRAKGLNIVLPDREGHEPTFNTRQTKPTQMSRGTMCVGAFPTNYVRKLTPAKRRAEIARDGEEDPSFISPFGTNFNLILQATVQNASVQNASGQNAAGQNVAGQNVAGQNVATQNANSRTDTLEIMELSQTQELEPNGNIDLYRSAHPNEQNIAKRSRLLPTFIPPSKPTDSGRLPFRFNESDYGGVGSASLSLISGTDGSVFDAVGESSIATTAATFSIANPAEAVRSSRAPFISSVRSAEGSVVSTSSLTPLQGPSNSIRRSVEFNPINPITIGGLGKSVKKANQNISMGLPPIVCSVCGVERKCRQDVAYRFDEQGRQKGPAGVGHQWVRCKGGDDSCPIWGHASCLFNIGVIPERIRTKKMLEELVYICVSHLATS